MSTKTIIHLAVISILMIAAFKGADAQQDSTGKYVIFNDTVYIGKYYYVLTSDNQTSICRILGVNKNDLLVYTDGETRSIDKNDIITIRNYAIGETEVFDIKYGKNETRFVLGAGISIPTSNNNYSYSRYKAGPNILAGITLRLNKNLGFRGDVDYNHFHCSDRTQTDPYNTTYESGGSLNNIAFRMNILMGDFTQEITNFCFSVGIGMGISYRGEKFYRSTYTYNGTTTIYEGTSAASNQIFILGSAGFTLSYPLNKKIRIFIEPQLNTYSGYGPGYFSLRGGIIL